MNIQPLNRFLAILSVIIPAFAANANNEIPRVNTTLPDKKSITEKLVLVNDYHISKNRMPGSNDWVNAVYFTGCMEFYHVYPDKAYLDYMNLWAENNKWQLGGSAVDHNADGQVCGQTYIDLYNLDTEKQDYKITAIREEIDKLVADRRKNDDWFWVDAFYMAMPLFTKLNLLYDKEAYLDKMHAMFTDSKDKRKLYHSDYNLWYRDGNQKNKNSNGNDVFWSRGNGWVLAALARVCRDLPEENRYRQEYITIFKEMAAALKDLQRPDGFWNVSLIDPEHYGGPETSGTALFTFGLAWGINNGILDVETYLPIVIKAWNGMMELAVKEDGFLGYVQDPGFKPESSQPVTSNSYANFGVGAFLLAGSEVVKLAEGEMPEPEDRNIPDLEGTEVTDLVITASGYEEGTENTPDKVMDKDFNTRWSAEGDQWILFDMKEHIVISAVDIALYVGNTRRTFFNIELSEDGTAWTKVFDGESSGTTDSWERYSFPPQHARYVKINGKGNTKNKWNSFTEVRIIMAETTGKTDSKTVSKTRIFPNPVTGSSFHIFLPDTNAGKDTRVIISDISGRNIFTQSYLPENNYIYVKDGMSDKGMYLVTIVSGNHKSTEILIAN